MSIYKARTYRDGNWWVVEITDGLPFDVGGGTQTHRLNDAEKAAAEMVSDLLEIEIDPADVELTIEMPVAVKGAHEALAEAEEAAGIARKAAITARQDLACAAIDEGLTMREAGILVGVSYQRIKQLLDDAKAADPERMAESMKVVVEGLLKVSERDDAPRPAK